MRPYVAKLQLRFGLRSFREWILGWSKFGGQKTLIYDLQWKGVFKIAYLTAYSDRLRHPFEALI